MDWGYSIAEARTNSMQVGVMEWDMMRGFYHACKMLDVSYETVANLMRLQQENIEAQNRSALKESVKREIERDKLKEEMLAEMKGK